jgi:integrase
MGRRPSLVLGGFVGTFGRSTNSSNKKYQHIARTTMALTDAKLRALKPEPKDYKLSDGEGLHIVIRTTGGKLWRLSYRFGGKQKTLPIGSYPNVTLLAARRARQDAKEQIAKGSDPALLKKAQKQARKLSLGNTFKIVANEWFALKENSWVTSYSSKLRSRLDEDLIADFGDRPIADILPLDVLRVLRKVEDRGAIEMAKRVKQMASSIFCYGVATGRCISDPTAALKGALKPVQPPKHRKALSASELPQFMEALENYDGDITTKLGLKIIIYTLVRTAELRFAKWSEIENLDGREPLWRIPEERMKMRRPHLVPLSTQAVSALRALRKVTGKREWLLAAATKSGVISENTLLYALYRMGYHSRATTHGFRTTASTILNEQQFNRDWIETQLSHSDGSVRGIYNAAEWLPGRRKMLSWWGDFVDPERARGAAHAA